MLVNNERVQIQRLSVPAGFKETLQVVENDQIAIQVTPGDLEVVINGQRTAGRIEPGTTFYVPKNAPHRFLNVGKAPYRRGRRDAQVELNLHGAVEDRNGQRRHLRGAWIGRGVV